MSGDHNKHQKPRSYLDDFEFPRCGHCCKSDLARVGEVGVWGEWVGLTEEETDELSRSMVKGDKSVNWLCRAIEAKLKEKNT